MEKIKRPRGRPPVADPAEDRIRVRVTKAQKAKYQAASERDKAPSLSRWITAILDREA